MPLVGVLVDGVDRRRDPVCPHDSAGIREARDECALRRIVVDALRDARAARISTQVHVQLAPRRAESRLLPHPALEVAAVAANLVDVVPAAADHAVERIGKPRRTVDRRIDPPSELLPSPDRLRRALRSRGIGDTVRRLHAAAAGREQRERREQEQALHGKRYSR